MPDTIDSVGLGYAQKPAESVAPSAASWEEGIDAALASGPLAMIGRQISRSGFEVDPNYKLDQKMLDDLSEGIDDDLRANFAEAVNPIHAQIIRSQALETTEHRRNLASLGYKGVALRVAADLIDPVNLAVGMATGGLGTAVRVGGSAARVSNAVKAGLIGAGGFAAIEGYKATQDPSITAGDVALSALGGGGFGVGAELTHGAGRLARFAGAGLGGAVPTAAAGTVMGKGTSDILYEAGSQLLLGGMVHALPGNAKMEVAARRMVKDVEFGDIKASVPKPALKFDGAPERSSLANEIAADPSAFVYHGTDIDSAQSISMSGLDRGGLANELTQALEYANKPGDIVLAFRKADLPPSLQKRLAGGRVEQLALLADYEAMVQGGDVPQASIVPIDNPLKAAGEFTVDELNQIAKTRTLTPKGEAYFKDQQPAAMLARAETAIAPHVDEVAWLDDIVKKYEPRQTEVPPPAVDDAIPSGGVKKPWEMTPQEHAQHIAAENGFDPKNVTGFSSAGQPIVKAGADSRSVPNARRSLKDGIEQRSPINAELFDGYNREQVALDDVATAIDYNGSTTRGHPLTLPDGYVREGDFYVYRGDAIPSGGAASPGNVAAAEEEAAKLAQYRQRLSSQKQFGDFDGSVYDDSYTAKPKLFGLIPIPRISKAAGVGQSALSELRRIGNMLLPDPLAKADGGVSRISAVEVKDMVASSSRGRKVNMSNAKYAEHVEHAKAGGEQPLTFKEWNSEVAKTIRRQPGTYTDDPTINETADLQRALTKETLEFTQRHGATGANDIEHDDLHLTRIGNRPVIDELTHEIGIENMQKVVAGAMMAGDKELAQLVLTDPAGAKRIADQKALLWIRKIGTAGWDTPDLSDAELKHIFDGYKPPKDKPGASDRLKRRMPMDETYVHTFDEPLILSDGTKLDKLSIEDLLVNDADEIHARYTNQMVGSALAQEIRNQMKTSSDEVLDTTEQLLAKIHEAGKTRFLRPSEYQDDVDKIAREMKRLEGQSPHDNNGNFAHRMRFIGRMLRKANNVRNMSNPATGAMNLLEFAEPIAETSTQAALNQMPALGTVLSRGAEGLWTDQHLRSLEIIYGFGTEFNNSRIQNSVVNESPLRLGTGKIGRWIDKKAASLERLVHKVDRAAFAVSGQSHGTDIMHAMAAAIIEQHWSDAAADGLKISPMRLAAMGLNEEDAGKILEQLKIHQTVAPSMSGTRLLDANLPMWQDAKAATSFRNAVYKTATRVILKPKAASGAMWMDSEIAKLFTQYRRYSLYSLDSKLGHIVQNPDATSIKKVVSSTATAMIGVGLLAYARSIGRDDREEYLRERLSLGGLAAGGFSRSPYSSVIPTIVDTIVSDVYKGKPIFSPSRTTNLTGGILMGNPTYDWAASAMDAWRSQRAIFSDDYDFTKHNAESIEKALWVPRLPFLHDGLSILAGNLPDESR